MTKDSNEHMGDDGLPAKKENGSQLRTMFGSKQRLSQIETAFKLGFITQQQRRYLKRAQAFPYNPQISLGIFEQDNLGVFPCKTR